MFAHSQSVDQNNRDNALLPVRLRFVTSTPAFGKEEDDAAAAQKEKDDAAAAEKEKSKKEPAPGSAEARVQGALTKAEEAEKRALAAEKKVADQEAAEKKRLEDEQKAKGEFKTLAETKEKEAADALAAKKISDDELAGARKDAEEEVQAAINGIKDEEKKKTVLELLEGKSPFEKRKLLPKMFASMGIAGGNTRVGAGLPGEGTEGQEKVEAEEKEYRTLLDKNAKAMQSKVNPALTPIERRRFQELGKKMQAGREQKKKADAENEKETVFF